VMNICRLYLTVPKINHGHFLGVVITSRLALIL